MHFYGLKRPGEGSSSAETDYVNVDPVIRGEAPRCPACGKFIGLIPWLPPHRAELELWGAAYGDVVFGTAYKLLVSERFKILYQEAGLSGLLGFDPVEIVRVKRCDRRAPRGAHPPYYCVSAVRSRAAIDQKASRFKWDRAPNCSECREGVVRSWKRIVIEPNTWSEEDVFEARGLGGYFASERFKDFCDAHKIANAVLIPAEEYAHNFYA